MLLIELRSLAQPSVFDRVYQNIDSNVRSEQYRQMSDWDGNTSYLPVDSDIQFSMQTDNCLRAGLEEVRDFKRGMNPRYTLHQVLINSQRINVQAA